MRDAKFVFVQVANVDSAKRLGEMLGQIDQLEFHFIIVPPEVNVMTAQEVVKMFAPFFTATIVEEKGDLSGELYDNLGDQ